MRAAGGIDNYQEFSSTTTTSLSTVASISSLASIRPRNNARIILLGRHSENLSFSMNSSETMKVWMISSTVMARSRSIR